MQNLLSSCACQNHKFCCANQLIGVEWPLLEINEMQSSSSSAIMEAGSSLHAAPCSNPTSLPAKFKSFSFHGPSKHSKLLTSLLSTLSTG
uniref:1-5-phosphoribosyl-5-5-phosphoribosylaminomethylideneamino imidazole-4-carboxamide isomeraseic-like n=1 Tax=Rhizophora mucronata TaxID=61149 RepID=A0A2P2IQS5_RHIMU